MRTSMLTAAGLVVVGLGGAMASGCFDPLSDCTQTKTCSPSTAGSSSSSGTGTGGTGGDGGTTPGCVPSENGKPVDDSCGVFVSSSLGNDGNPGTKDKPLATLGAALAKAKGGAVYACAENFKEVVTIDAGVSLFGAVDCTKGWAYDASKKTTLTANADAISMTLVSTANGAEVVDLAIVAAASKVAGGSSIAVLVNGATASFTRCDLTAGDASDGDAGMSGGAQEAQAEGGKVGGDAGLAGVGSIVGGSGGQNSICSLAGGKGGDGGLIPSGDGGDGAQGDVNSGGAKGTGDTGSGCMPGGQGANGMPGPFGAGASGIGVIDASGYHGADGGNGQDGTNGKSGGGGGGSKASATVHGAGGGGGGAGGCAGKLGTGGKAGGSSIALVSLDATLTLTECKLKSGKGGSGGAGGDGQFGQLGGALGSAGQGSMNAGAGCAGGAGGKGGDGGNGGGGGGGHSLGLAFTGAAPMLDATTRNAISPGTKGSGGLGGNADVDANHGADGMAGSCWDFGTNAACK